MGVEQHVEGAGEPPLRYAGQEEEEADGVEAKHRKERPQHAAAQRLSQH